jgi:hypothetical protein
VDSWGTFGAKNSVKGLHLYLEKEKKISRAGVVIMSKGSNNDVSSVVL